jgi:hypothetical protein
MEFPGPCVLEPHPSPVNLETCTPVNLPVRDGLVGIRNMRTNQGSGSRFQVSEVLSLLVHG